MMIINRKIDATIKEILEDKMSEAEVQGYNFIEIRHVMRGPTAITMMGLDQARVVRSSSSARGGFDTYRVTTTKDGVLEFHPDSSGARWAYVLGTEDNKEWIALAIAGGKVTCGDAEITKNASRINRKRPPKKDKNMVNYLGKRKLVKKSELSGNREAELQSQVNALLMASLSNNTPNPPVADTSALEEQLKALQAQVIAMTKTIEEEGVETAPIEDIKPVLTKKPLAGVKVKAPTRKK